MRLHGCRLVVPVDGLPLSYGAPAPAAWKPRYFRRRDSEPTADQCTVKGRHFFVHGPIGIPVRDSGDTFSRGVWVSLSETNFARTHDLWDAPARAQEPPYSGWLSTELSVHPQTTLHPKTHVHTRAVGRRPLVEVEPTDHPLTIEQREGIATDRVKDLADLLLRG
ncbi:DUF2199 domain-containing protein [Streptomyces sp. NPDC056491]|uniref:DUF2199 domain-containing protein n=1 Tax=Streptomyces sp. NPDC056491 TaxID=3345837 RepID=UPI00369D4719